MDINSGISRTKLTAISAKIRTVACEMSYAIAVIVAVVLIPFALLLRTGVEIKAALRHGQMSHSYAKPVYN
jgi:hypothetical protein